MGWDILGWRNCSKEDTQEGAGWESDIAVKTEGEREEAMQMSKGKASV